MCNTRLNFEVARQLLKANHLNMFNLKKSPYRLAIKLSSMVDLAGIPRSSGTSPEPSVRGNLSPRNQTYQITVIGGPEESRTPDLLIANEAL